jgi:hypothetical protein
MAVVVAAPAIFFNLYVVHDYYFIAIYPAMSALLAMGLCELSALRFARRVSVAWVAAIGGVAVLFVALCGQVGASYLRQFAQPAPVPSLAAALNAETKPSDLVLTVGCDWDPLLLYVADRRGLMIRTEDPALRPTASEVTAYPVVVACGVDPNRYLPPGFVAKPTQTPKIFRISRTA